MEVRKDTVWNAIENTDGYKEYEHKAIEYLLESPCFVLTWDIGHSKAIGDDVRCVLEKKTIAALRMSVSWIRKQLNT